MNNIRLKTIPLLETNYCYILHNGLDAVVIDPGESAPVISELKKMDLTISDILLTHSHNDHSGGVEKIIDFFPDTKITDWRKQELYLFNNELQVRVIKTPGHTKDSCCFHIPSLNYIFTGDTLFTGICGRVIEGSYIEMYKSLQAIKSLPGETRILPGHEYLAYAIKFIKSLGENPEYYEGLETSLNVKISSEITHNLFMTNDYNEFKKLRILKDLN